MRCWHLWELEKSNIGASLGESPTPAEVEAAVLGDVLESVVFFLPEKAQILAVGVVAGSDH